MTEAKMQLLDERVQDQYIIDTDFHLNVPADKLTQYIGNDTIRRKVEAFGPPSPVEMGGIKSAYAKDSDMKGGEAHGIAITRDEIHGVMQEMGLDKVIVQPTNYLPFPTSRYPAVKNAITQAYNDYLIDEVTDPEKGVYAGLVVPDWDPELALEELDRYGSENGIVAAQNWIPGYRPISAHENDEIVDKVDSLGLPFLLHVGGGSSNRFTTYEDSKRTYTEAVVTNLAKGTLDSVANMAMTGLFDTYPDLDVVVAEAGANWLPFLLYRLDEFYQLSPEDVSLTERKLEAGEQYLDRLPSESIFDNLYVTTQPICLPNNPTEALGLMRACKAERTFMFSTDWPHSTMDLPSWVFDNPKIDDELRNQIFHETAEDVFNFN